MPFPVDDKLIVAAEAKLDLRFPRALRDRLRRANGGEVEINSATWWLYPVRDDSDRRRLKRTASDIVLETEQARQWRGFPRAAIAIGHNGGSDQLVLFPSADEPGWYDDTLYWWDHETGQVHPVSVDWLSDETDER